MIGAHERQGPASSGAVGSDSPERPSTAGSELGQYYRFERGDILAVVPASVRRVLSVGCATGATEAVLAKRGMSVVGIELNPAAAAAARARGLTVIEGNANAIQSELNGYRFDCLIYADVLEHLPDPVSVLRSHIALLDPGGTVIVSVPNFRHYSVFAALFLRGHIRYADAGIFDRTHVRITTRKLMLEYFRDCGIEPLVTKYTMARNHHQLISACMLGLADEFIASQVLVVGRKAPFRAS
jgi:SAM-dependent methyltransferase